MYLNFLQKIFYLQIIFHHAQLKLFLDKITTRIREFSSRRQKPFLFYFQQFEHLLRLNLKFILQKHMCPFMAIWLSAFIFTSWGTFAIMIAIAVPISNELGINPSMAIDLDIDSSMSEVHLILLKIYC